MAKAPTNSGKTAAKAPPPPVEEEEVQAADVEINQEEGEESGGMTVDLSGVEESGGFEALPRGVYDVEISNLTYGKSNRSGNWMWTWELTVCEGDYVNRKLFYHTTFNEGGIGRVKRTLARLSMDDGYNKELLAAPFNPETVADEGRLIGARCKARVDVRPYEGEKRNNVRDILPAGGGDGFGS